MPLLTASTAALHTQRPYDRYRRRRPHRLHPYHRPTPLAHQPIHPTPPNPPTRPLTRSPPPPRPAHRRPADALPSEKQPAEHILLAAARDPAALLEDGAFGRYGGPALNRFERMSITVGGVLAQKQQMTEVAPCFVMRGAMVVGAAGGRIACNKFVVEGLGLEALAEALAARGCLVVYASAEVCRLEGPGAEAGVLCVLVGSAGEAAVPKVGGGGGGVLVGVGVGWWCVRVGWSGVVWVLPGGQPLAPPRGATPRRCGRTDGRRGEWTGGRAA